MWCSFPVSVHHGLVPVLNIVLFISSYCAAPQCRAIWYGFRDWAMTILDNFMWQFQPFDSVLPHKLRIDKVNPVLFFILTKLFRKNSKFVFRHYLKMIHVLSKSTAPLFFFVRFICCHRWRVRFTHYGHESIL